MIVTIDGPVASGKSTVARLIANSLGFTLISSGFLFRALGHELLYTYHYSLEELLLIINNALLDEIFNTDHFEYTYDNEHGPRVFLKGIDITSRLKMPIIDKAASILGTSPLVRNYFITLQHLLAHNKNSIIEGRDSGSVVFPNADIKFFLTASLEVRAQRWQKMQKNLGLEFSLDEAKKIIKERDDRDYTRSIAPLKIPEDALVVDNSNLTLPETINYLISYIQNKI